MAEQITTKPLSRLPAWLLQAGRFGVVGLANTAIDLGSYALLTHLLPFFAVQPVLTKAISYSLGVMNSYFWNRRWTFRSQRGGWRTLGLFWLVNLAGIGINALAMALALGVTGAGADMLAAVLASGATLVWNFALSKLLVFRQST